MAGRLRTDGESAMTSRDAEQLIAEVIARDGGTWADLGAGEGTFTRALARLIGPSGRVYAVDRNAGAIAALELVAESGIAEVIPVRADFTQPFELPGLGDAGLDGMLLANALHFIADAEHVLARLAEWLRPGGRVVFVEYDQRPASQWVPYPLPAERLAEVAKAAGLTLPVIVSTRHSAFGGNLYLATAERPATAPPPPPQP